MGEDLFNMDNILSGDEAAALFGDVEQPEEKNPKETLGSEEAPKEQDTDIAEVKNSEDLFEVEPESVGNEENLGGEDTATEGNNSPDEPNFYSSITDALVDDGIFPDLTEERIKQVQTPEDFRNLIEERIKAEFDERSKRIYDALNAGVDTGLVRQYESTLEFLNRVTPEILTEEGDRGEDVRRRLLLQDFLNKNFSLENANKMIKVLMDSGEDIEQAKLALVENKKYFTEKYRQILDEAKKEEELEKQRIQQQAELLKKDILSSEKIFGDIEIDKNTRQKVYDNISKPVYKDKQTGEFYTALLKYKLENENDFIKNVGLLFTLTDGFKDLSKIVAPSTKKEVRKKMKELEQKLNNTVRNTGNYKYVGTTSKESSKSFLDRGFTIDI